jgi:hypothetical protein
MYTRLVFVLCQRRRCQESYLCVTSQWLHACSQTVPKGWADRYGSAFAAEPETTDLEHLVEQSQWSTVGEELQVTPAARDQEPPGLVSTVTEPCWSTMARSNKADENTNSIRKHVSRIGVGARQDAAFALVRVWGPAVVSTSSSRCRDSVSGWRNAHDLPSAATSESCRMPSARVGSPICHRLLNVRVSHRFGSPKTRFCKLFPQRSLMFLGSRDGFELVLSCGHSGSVKQQNLHREAAWNCSKPAMY